MYQRWKEKRITMRVINSLQNFSIEKDALVKFNAFYGKSFSILDYALGSKPVGIIAKSLLSLYVLKYDGKTS